MIRLGRLMGVPVYVSYSWFVIAALIAYWFAPLVDRVAPDVGAARYLVGAAFAVLLYLALLLHEWAHARAASHYGFRVDSITLHLLGGHTSISGEAKSPRQEFWIAVVGPLASLAVGLVAYLVARALDPGILWLAAAALATANLTIGVLNLLPGLPLDGGHILKSIWWAISGNPHTGTLAAGWVGRGLAVLVILWPVWLLSRGTVPGIAQIALNLILGLFLWQAATASMHRARFRSRLPQLRVDGLMRPFVAFPADTPWREVMRSTDVVDNQANFSIAVSNAQGEVVGVVSPQRRAQWSPNQLAEVPLRMMAIDAAAHRLPADLAGEELILALSRVPSDVYAIYSPQTMQYVGVLFTADVERAFSQEARG